MGWVSLCGSIELMVLKVAAHNEVFLFDLLNLPIEPAGPVDRCLSSLLASTDCLKLGCGISSDFTLLARMLPGMQAFQHVAGIIELRWDWSLAGSIWHAYQ